MKATFDEVISLSQRLNTLPVDFEAEQCLRVLEKKIANNALPMVRQAAMDMGSALLQNPEVPLASEISVICYQRYVLVPLLYKLGFSSQASQLKQQTFEKLFSALNQSITEKLNDLYGCDRIEKAQAIVKPFTIGHPAVVQSYVRLMKTNDSIWSKIPSIQVFQRWSKDDMAHGVDDLVALRWNMAVQSNENRFDALINGIRLLPASHLISFRNQQVEQSSGFDCEPVMKFYYVIDGFPVECQLLGGQIEWYMNAKGYTNYKAQCVFPPMKSTLASPQYDARLALCVWYQETHQADAYHQLMLRELLTEAPVHYEPCSYFTLDHAPSTAENCSLKFCDNTIYIYQLQQHDFQTGKLHLENITASCHRDRTL